MSTNSALSKYKFLGLFPLVMALFQYFDVLMF